MKTKTKLKCNEKLQFKQNPKPIKKLKPKWKTSQNKNRKH